MEIGFLIGFLIVYFLPALIASQRKHTNKTPIFLTNLFLGWTLIGWVAALVWSTTAQKV
jgi:biotin transporter BioY